MKCINCNQIPELCKCREGEFFDEEWGDDPQDSPIATEAVDTIEQLQSENADLRERLSEQIEDSGRIHDEKMKFYLQAQDLRERLARLEAEVERLKELEALRIELCKRLQSENIALLSRAV